jgi:Ca-activated chloride channel family protein
MHRPVAALLFVLLLAPPCAVVAQEVGLDQVGGGSLLWRSEHAGGYRRAPVQATSVEMEIRGLLAEVVVVQTFTNPTDEWMEGVYAFPLPTDAAVHGMRLEIGDRIIEGRFQERALARKTYETAVRQGKKASLVEQERPNLFTTSVANVGPGESVSVRLEYQEILAWAQDGFELRFPMVIGPRYTPDRTAEIGAGWATDAELAEDTRRITPPVLHPSDGLVNPVTLSVALDAGLPLASLECPSHRVTVADDGPGRRSVAFPTPQPADRDFVLRWSPARGSEPRAAVFTESLADASYALVMVMPPADGAAKEARLPREVVFIIDTSGSMGGDSIVQARRALQNALNRLHPEDWFNIIEFNSTFRSFAPESQAAVPSAIERAHSWVASLHANGGTEMMPALMAAFMAPPAPAPVRQVVFITDGCVGNEDALFRAIEQELGDTRLFTVGIGSAPNAHFMERAAAFGRGTSTFVGAPSEVAERMGALFGAIEQPMLTDVEVRWPDPGAVMWPERIPDLYAGEPLILVAELAVTDGPLEISGVRSDEPWSATIPLEIGDRRAGIDRFWARRAIADLMDRRTRGAAEDEIRHSVVELALRHGLVSRYTSLVAVDVTPSRPEEDDMASGRVPTNLPKGWQYEKVFGTLPRTGTSWRLQLLLSAMLLAAALVAWRLRVAP